MAPPTSRPSSANGNQQQRSSPHRRAPSGAGVQKPKVAPSTAGVQKPRTPRLRQSCDQCFVAKVKCSKDNPMCHRCLHNGSPCIYSPTARVGKPARQANGGSNNQSRGQHQGIQLQHLTAQWANLNLGITSTTQPLMQPMTSPVPSPFPMNQQMNQPTWTSMSHTPQSQQTFVTMPGVGNHYMVPDNQVLSSANFSAMMNGPQTHQGFVTMPGNGNQDLTPGNLSPTMEAGGMSPRDESLAGLVPDLWDQNLATFDSQQQGYFPFPPDQQVTPTTSGHSRSMSLDMMSVNIASTPFSGIGSPIEAIPPSFGQAVGSTPQMSNHLPGHHRNLSAPAMIPDHVSECTCVQSGLNTLSRVTSMVANHELSYHDFMIENQSVCQAWTTVLQCPRCMGASLQRCMALSFLDMCFQQQMRSFQTLVEGLRPGPVNMAMPESDQWTQIFQDLQQALTDLNQAWLEMRQLITPEIAEYDFFASALVNNAWRALDRSASMLQTKKSQLSAPLSATGLPVRLKRHI